MRTQLLLPFLADGFKWKLLEIMSHAVHALFAWRGPFLCDTLLIEKIFYLVKCKKIIILISKEQKNTNSNFLQLSFLPSLYSKFPTLLLNCGNVSLTNGKDGSSTMCQWRTLNLLYDKASWQAQKRWLFSHLYKWP